MANGLRGFYSSPTSYGRNSLPPINAAMPGYGDPIRTMNNLQNIQMNKLKLDETPNEYARAAAQEQRAAAGETRTAERHAWENDDRNITAEMKAINAAIAQKSPEDSLSVYNRLRPKGAREAGLPEPKPTFSRQGGSVTVDGGPGQIKLAGPEGAVSRLLEEVEKYPSIVKDPQMFKQLAEAAAKLGVSITQNAPATAQGWKPGSKAEALEMAEAKSRGAGSDKTQARIDRLRKEAPRLAKMKEDIRKGTTMDQIIAIMTAADPEMAKEMQLKSGDTKEAAIAKIDEYERWTRKELRRLEVSGSSSDPLGFKTK